tara:strand:+ start:235 stop:456 length:222 start_codon:yes stop_codon:yes gene_type:complete
MSYLHLKKSKKHHSLLYKSEGLCLGYEIQQENKHYESCIYTKKFLKQQVIEDLENKIKMEILETKFELNNNIY